MFHEFAGLVDDRGVAVRYGGKWQNDDVHESVDEGPIEETVQEWALGQKAELTTGQVEDCGSAEGDDEVQNSPKGSGLESSAISLTAEEPAGDGLRNKDRLVGAVDHDCIQQVDNADDESANEDRRERSRYGIYER